MTNIKRFENCLEEAADLVKSGEVIGVPTDTVYGLACDASNAEAISRLYALKRRPRSKPLQAVFPSVSSLKDFDLFLPYPLDLLAGKFLPGGICPIALAGEGCPLATAEKSGGEKSQAVRVPNAPLLLELSLLCGPLACSSANISSFPTSESAEEAASAFKEAVPLYASSSQKPAHIPSTVIRSLPGAKGGIEILREGEVSSEEIYRFLSKR
ncbi:MAG: L-threonylcarbamoyladenylate synthase [Bifidobacteriaceae bacterium]|nr:L-threonylcarbamoyladenylate synthase [Bifidobacteriaceae bacterium]